MPITPRAIHQFNAVPNWFPRATSHFSELPSTSFAVGFASNLASFAA